MARQTRGWSRPVRHISPQFSALTRRAAPPKFAVTLRKPERPEHFVWGISHLRVRSGHDFSSYKKSTIRRRIARRMQIQRAATIADYLATMREDPTETQALFADLLISVTTFFRDTAAFDKLAALLIPRLFDNKSASDTVRAGFRAAPLAKRPIRSQSCCLRRPLVTRSAAACGSSLIPTWWNRNAQRTVGDRAEFHFGPGVGYGFARTDDECFEIWGAGPEECASEHQLASAGRERGVLDLCRLEGKRCRDRSTKWAAGGWQWAAPDRRRLALSVRSPDNFRDRAGRRALHDCASAPRTSDGGDPGWPIPRFVIAVFLLSRTST